MHWHAVCTQHTQKDIYIQIHILQSIYIYYYRSLTIGKSYSGHFTPDTSHIFKFSPNWINLHQKRRHPVPHLAALPAS